MNIRSRFGFISLALSVLLLVSSFMATRQVEETRQQELQDQQQQEAGSQDNRVERRGHKRGIE